ncbi:uncharacterized protein LOC141909333 [Tubulanus polymorphus]|uniref:uncharacterized protein LOC141909333 n=1 Tax=Tubulanus polymorphus TaxID=672921 RepID=UPI003DA20368
MGSRKTGKSIMDIYNFPNLKKRSEEKRKLTMDLFRKKCLDSDLQNSDTDLDMDEDEMLGIKKKDPSDSCKMYEGACKRYGVVPSSHFIKQINRKKTEMRLVDMAIEVNELKAMCIPLLNNTHVTSLDISGNSFGKRGLNQLVDMLKENVFIVYLNLSNNDLGSYGARAVNDLLTTNQRLKSINVSGNKFCEEDAKAFAAILKQNVTLRSLNLSHNEFGEIGGKHIGSVLGENISLEELDLSWNHIRLKGAIAIAKGLKENDTLQRLNLAWNGFGNQGARALGEALADGTGLVDLDLTSNRIGIVGVNSLTKGLMENKTLKVLKLKMNPISTIGAEKMLKALAENSSVVKVDIDGVPVTYDFGVLLEEIKGTKTNLEVKHGPFVRKEDAIILKELANTSYKADPLKVLMKYIAEKQLGLEEIFTTCQLLGPTTLSEEDFKLAIQMAAIPLSDDQLDSLTEAFKKDASGMEFSDSDDEVDTFVDLKDFNINEERLTQMREEIRRKKEEYIENLGQEDFEELGILKLNEDGDIIEDVDLDDDSFYGDFREDVVTAVSGAMDADDESEGEENASARKQRKTKSSRSSANRAFPMTQPEPTTMSSEDTVLNSARTSPAEIDTESNEIKDNVESEETKDIEQNSVAPQDSIQHKT